MVRVKMMPSGEIALIDNQKVQVFDKFGVCDTNKYDALIPRYTQGMQALPVLSVLSSRSVDDQTEIALFNVDDTMEKVIVKVNKVVIKIKAFLVVIHKIKNNKVMEIMRAVLVKKIQKTKKKASHLFFQNNSLVEKKLHNYNPDL